MATYLIIYDTKKEATAYHAHDKQITDAIKSIEIIGVEEAVKILTGIPATKH